MARQARKLRATQGGWLACMLLVVLGACAEGRPAQLAIVVGTNLEIGRELDAAQVSVREDDERGELLFDRAGRLRSERPVTFVLTSRSGHTRRLHVTVEGKLGSELKVRRRILSDAARNEVFGFVDRPRRVDVSRLAGRKR